MTTCVRHSYKRGEEKPRQCRRCGAMEDGRAPPIVLTPAADARPDEPPADAGATTLPALLPEHSPLGASSAERWMNCPGSVALIHAIKTGEGFVEDDPDYRRDGVEAHALAAWCLEHEVDAWEAPVDAFPSLTLDMLDAVQIYLDFCTSLQGRFRYVETRVHRPEFHPLFYGTLDFAAIMVAADEADFVDYKHGEGVYVEVIENVQLRYYVYGFIAENREEYPDAMVIRLHVCQPRYPGAEPVRTRQTTAGEIRAWAHTVLRPAMDATIRDRYLSVGEHCRFCPAKIVCPAMTSLADEMTYHRETPLQAMSAEVLGDFYAKAQIVRMLAKAIEAETARRVLAGEQVPGVKAVQKRADRVWKTGAEAALVEAMHPCQSLYTAPALRSPAQVEKLPEGKALVAEWAFVPDNGLTIALDTDKRAAVSVKSGAETFGAALLALESGE